MQEVGIEAVEELGSLIGLGEAEAGVAGSIQEGIDMGLANVTESSNLMYKKGIESVISHMEGIAQGFAFPQGFTFGTMKNIDDENFKALSDRIKRDRYFQDEMVTLWSRFLPRAEDPHFIGKLNPWTGVRNMVFISGTALYPREKYNSVDSDYYKISKNIFWKSFVDYPLLDPWSDKSYVEDLVNDIVNDTDKLTYMSYQLSIFLNQAEYMLGLREWEDIPEVYRIQTYMFKPVKWNGQTDDFYKFAGNEPKDSGWFLDQHYYRSWFNDTWNLETECSQPWGAAFKPYKEKTIQWRCWLEPWSIFPTVKDDGTLDFETPLPIERQKILFDSNFPSDLKKSFSDFYYTYAPVLYDFIANPPDKYRTVENNIYKLKELNNTKKGQDIINDPELNQQTKYEELGRTKEWDRLELSFNNLYVEFNTIYDYYYKKNDVGSYAIIVNYLHASKNIADNLNPSNNAELYPFSNYNEYTEYETDLQKHLEEWKENYNKARQKEIQIEKEKQLKQIAEKEEEEEVYKENQEYWNSRNLELNKLLEITEQERVDELNKQNIAEEKAYQKILKKQEKEEERETKKKEKQEAKFKYKMNEYIQDWGTVQDRRKTGSKKEYLVIDEDSGFEAWVEESELTPAPYLPPKTFEPEPEPYIPIKTFESEPEIWKPPLTEIISKEVIPPMVADGKGEPVYSSIEEEIQSKSSPTRRLAEDKRKSENNIWVLGMLVLLSL